MTDHEVDVSAGEQLPGVLAAAENPAVQSAPAAEGNENGPPETESAAKLAHQRTEGQTALAADRPNAQRFQPRKARAVAVTGALIIRLEGATVIYRKKCISCGHEDPSQSRMPVRNGVTRLNFFCPKCRKPRPVQIQGIT